MTAAQWYFDPITRHQYRYWDGNAWTDDVADLGTGARDPLATGLPKRKSTVEQFVGLAAPVDPQSIDIAAAVRLAQGYNDHFGSNALRPYLTGWAQSAGWGSDVQVMTAVGQVGGVAVHRPWLWLAGAIQRASIDGQDLVATKLVCVAYMHNTQVAPNLTTLDGFDGIPGTMPPKVAANLYSAGVQAVLRVDPDAVVFSNTTGTMVASGVQTMCCSAIESLPTLVAPNILELARAHFAR